VPVTVQAAVPTPPYALTDLGRSLGLQDADITCCPAHNSFAPPDPSSALKPLDVDSAGRVVTLVADTPRFTSLGETPVTPTVVQQVGAALPPAKTCIARKRLSLKLRKAGTLRFRRATVFVNGKRVRRVSGKRVTKRFSVRVPSGSGRIKVRIVVQTRGKQQLVIRKNYRRCG